jgi:hypothetical protein
MQDMKGDLHKDIENLKKQNKTKQKTQTKQIEALERKSSLSQIKNSDESVSNRLNQMKDRISGMRTKYT